MKVLMLNGSPHEHGCTCTALREAADAIEKRGIETEILWLGKGEVSGCMGCGACRRIGKCVRNDVVNETAAKLGEYDALIVGSPVYYAGPSGQICAFLDRLFYSAGGKLAGKPGAAVVSCRRGGATAAFDRLNKYFTINCMPIVSSNYWNQIHGNTPEEAKQDAEGLQTMRTLGENMAWLLQCIEAGRKAGVPAPEAGPKIKTNFIR